MITCILKSPTKPDLELSISSCSSRMQTIPDTSSISVVVPNGVILADEIFQRLDGYLELYYHGVLFGITTQIDSAPLYEGASSTSLQINATGQYPTHTPVNVDLEEVTYKSLNVNGDVRLRAKFNPLITPQSTVNYQGSVYTVDSITFTSNNGGSTMELFINA